MRCVAWNAVHGRISSHFDKIHFNWCRKRILSGFPLKYDDSCCFICILLLFYFLIFCCCCCWCPDGVSSLEAKGIFQNHPNLYERKPECNPIIFRMNGNDWTNHVYDGYIFTVHFLIATQNTVKCSNHRNVSICRKSSSNIASCWAISKDSKWLRLSANEWS